MLKLKTPSIVIHWLLLRTGPDFRQSLGNPPERSTERTANSVLTKNFLLPWPQNNSYLGFPKIYNKRSCKLCQWYNTPQHPGSSITMKPHIAQNPHSIPQGVRRKPFEKL